MGDAGRDLANGGQLLGMKNLALQPTKRCQVMPDRHHGGGRTLGGAHGQDVERRRQNAATRTRQPHFTANRFPPLGHLAHHVRQISNAMLGQPFDQNPAKPLGLLATGQATQGRIPGHQAPVEIRHGDEDIRLLHHLQ